VFGDLTGRSWGRETVTGSGADRAREGYCVLVATSGNGPRAEFDVTRVVRSGFSEAVVSFKLPLKTARGARSFPLQIQIVHRQERVVTADSPPAVEVSNRLVVAN
jgi:hypothetical protein